ncbi:MAG: class I SAM-dependent methyltransferase [Pseudomonadota bacterium]
MKRIEEQTQHGVLKTGSLDDRARQDFAFTFRNKITSDLMPANRLVFDQRAAGRFEKANGTAPQSPADIRKAMEADSFYTSYLSVRRTSQEMIWRSVLPAIDGTEDIAVSTSAGGSLTLDPDVKAPRYVDAIDIHCMPGGYCQDTGSQATGALYDRGVYLYLSGLTGGMNDGNAQLAALDIKKRMPDFNPAKILDLGCGVGHSTLPYVQHFPEAEVHGIDVGPDLLRYAHARAEADGKAVHFHQANAESTPFEDESFDLVTSHIVLHETSRRGLPAIFKECFRLLKPGGVMLHVDQPGFANMDAFSTFLQENETYYNNEPFWRQFRRTDMISACVNAGFSEDACETDLLVSDVIKQNQNNGPKAKAIGFLMVIARKEDWARKEDQA